MRAIFDKVNDYADGDGSNDLIAAVDWTPFELSEIISNAMDSKA